MYSTAKREIDGLLGALVGRIRDTLGGKLLAVYLYGSLVTGDFDGGVSDIDLLAVTTDDLDDRFLSQLKLMHENFARQHAEWDDRIEVAYASADGLRTFKHKSSKVGIISPGEPFHGIEAGADWLINWYAVQKQGIPLFGPLPQLFIEDVSQDEFVRAVRDQVRKWPRRLKPSASRPYQAYAVLTLCRGLYSCRHGQQVSKQHAALWAVGEYPEWAYLIQSALAWRSEWRLENVDHASTYSEVIRFVGFAATQVQG